MVELDDIPFWITVTTYVSYLLFFIFGKIRDGYRLLVPSANVPSSKGYCPLLGNFDDFFSRRMYGRIKDAWNCPIDSKPGSLIRLMLRDKSCNPTGETSLCLNLSSYNYLGFAENPKFVNEYVHKTLDHYGLSSCSMLLELGSSRPVLELEKMVASFVGKEAAVVFGMGFATNSTSIPTLLSKGSLLLSDHLNHCSLVTGCRQSGATIKVFKHNDFVSLERMVRKAIISGRPRTHAKWTKIVIMVEGIYSMEGEIVDLPSIVKIAKKYKCFIYIDEAHSIGALGERGRGVCDHFKIDPSEIDILMGTFTKSFGSVGGYVAASKELIKEIRQTSAGTLYANSMSPPCAQQIISALTVINGDDGTDIGLRKIRQLRDNSIFFRQSLIDRGFQVCGSYGSPVVVAMIYQPGKVIGFSRECRKRGLAVVVVGYPACPLVEARVRFCLSAAHTRKQLEAALDIVDEVGEYCFVKYCKK